MTESALLNYFRLDEKVIYSHNDGFSIPNKSIVGSHYLYFTNKGRIFAFDSGGVFGSQQVVEYDPNLPLYRISVSLEFSGVLLKSKTGSAISFEITMNYDDFLELYKQVSSKSIFTFDGKVDWLIKTEESYVIGKGTLTEHELELKLDWDLPFEPIEPIDSTYTIPYSRVISGSHDSAAGILKLKGYFNHESKVTSELLLFTTNPTAMNGLKERIQQSKNSLRSLPTNALVSEVSITMLKSDGSIGKSSAILSFIEGVYNLIDGKDGSILKTFGANSRSIYYNQQKENLLVTLENEIPFLIHLEDSTLKYELIKQFSSSSYSYLGLLTGVFSGAEYFKEPISIMYNQEANQFLFFSEQTLTIGASFHLSELIVNFFSDCLFIIYNESVLLLQEAEASEAFNLIASKKEAYDLDNYPIAVFETGIPFLVHLRQKGIELIVDGKAQHIDYTDIEDFTITDQEEDSVFSFATLRYKKEGSKSELNLSLTSELVKKIIYQSFLNKQLPKVETSNSRKLFASWSRQNNDYILYHFLGQLFAIKAGIEQIQNEEIEHEMKQAKLANLLYYGLQSQKQQMDKASVYIPAMMEKRQAELFREIGAQTSQVPYKQMQRQLLSSSSQIGRHIHETLSALNAISFAIIPRKELEGLLEKRLLRNGGLAILGSFVSIPMGIFLGANTLFSYFDSKKQEQLKKENEQLRLDFYLEKAIDTFYHFMDIMLPYYLTEMNEQLYASFQLVAKLYDPILEQKKVSEFLLLSMGEYHTFKQMPIDDSVIIKKGELIEEVHQSLSSAIDSIKQYEDEVKIYVSEPLQLK